MKIDIKLRDDKPQGFQIAKLAKMGIFGCLYDCGSFFSTEAEAKFHVPCSSRENCDRNCEKIRELGRKKRIEVSLENDAELQPNPLELNNNSITVNSEEDFDVAVENAGDPIPVYNAQIMEQSVFDNLPVQSPEDRVIWFLITSDFNIGWAE